MTEELTGGKVTRRRRIKRGDGMVTPIRALEVRHPDGRVERLVPGRSRLAPEHEWVRARPDLYVAAYAGDTATRDLLRDAIRRRSRRTSTRPPAPRGRYRLTSTGSGTGRFRLP